MTGIFRNKNFALLDDVTRKTYPYEVRFEFNKRRIIALARLHYNIVSYQLIAKRLGLKGEYLNSLMSSLVGGGVFEKKTKNSFELTEKFQGIPEIPDVSFKPSYKPEKQQLYYHFINPEKDDD